MKPRLTVHIGQGKTGTSLIQATCSLNRSTLARDFKLVYPSVPNDPFSFEPTHHEFFFRMGEYRPVHEVREFLQFAFDLASSRSANHVLLSWESFQDEAWMDQLAEALRAFDVDLQLLVYLRRQDHWIESSWKQWHNKLHGDPSVVEYAEGVDCDWHAWLERWAARFGRERIQVRPYEKEQLPNGLLADFFEAIGCSAGAADALERPPANNAVLNRGFRPSVMEVLSLSKELNRGRHDNRLFDAFTRLLGEQFKKREFESYDLLTPAQRLAILERWEPSNRRIATDYLQRGYGQLFYEPWPSPTGALGDGAELTVEKLVPILVDMIVRLHDRVQALEARAEQAESAAPAAPSNLHAR